jgi:hypothetical protein
MAPFDDASCSGSTTGQSLTTSWNRIFTTEDTQHQDRLRPTTSSNGLGETMRSRPSSLTEESEVQEVGLTHIHTRSYITNHDSHSMNSRIRNQIS